MATFERDTDGPSSSEAVQHTKYPIARLELSIKKFLKVIQIDLARLHQHKLNVEKYNHIRDWDSLNCEQINATRTIQQIKATIHEIEKCRLQVCEDDLEKFDGKIDTMKCSAIQSVEELLNLMHAKTSDDITTDSNIDDSADENTRLSSDFYQTQLQLNELPQNTKVAESWDALQENLEELNELIHHFGTAVSTQQEHVDNIVDNIEKAQIDVREGSKQLGKAVGYKAAIFPIAGALIGTVVGGPFGFVAGAKIGGVIGAVGGGTAGLISGRFLKRRTNQITEMELQKLSRSNSLPDLKVEPATGNSWFGWRRQRNQSTTVIEDTGS